MVTMSTFDEAQHPRGQAANAGQFATKVNTAPAGTLDPALTPALATALETASRPLGLDQLLESASAPESYLAHQVPHEEILSRLGRPVTGAPSRRINEFRPSFTGSGERDFAVALERIDAVWDPTHTTSQRTEAIVADMRRSGALGSGGGAALEAYARALNLNETGGYIIEEQVNHLLDHMEAGGADYAAQARAFGYHPEQFAVEVAHAARAADYQAVNAPDELTRLAAEARRDVLQSAAIDGAARFDRGWSSMDDDAAMYYDRHHDADRDVEAADTDQKRVRAAAVRDAYAYMIDKIECA